MLFRDCGEIRYYQFDSFNDKVCHAIFTRRGGASPKPWASLNMGGTVGDDPLRVTTNRQAALATLGRETTSVFDVWQVHSAEVVIGTSPHPVGTPHQRADAILTDKHGLTLMMRFADCVPVFLYDPRHHVVGIAHAGWLGTVRGIIKATIEALKINFHTNPADLLAGIGPSIGPDHYIVGEDVVNQVKEAFSGDASELLIRNDDQTAFDLWAANRLSLERAGVNHIEVSGLCTACNTEDWYSHRAEQGRTGRFGAIIALR